MDLFSQTLKAAIVLLLVFSCSVVFARSNPEQPPTLGDQPFFVIDGGLNDAWYDPNTPGQGFFIAVFPDSEIIFLGWFTFDTERPPQNVEAILGDPGQRWLTAFGGWEDNIATLQIESTEGGIFDESEPVPTQKASGTVEIEFIDCNNAIVRYNIPSSMLTGEIPVTRIAEDNIIRCLVGQPQ